MQKSCSTFDNLAALAMRSPTPARPILWPPSGGPVAANLESKFLLAEIMSGGKVLATTKEFQSVNLHPAVVRKVPRYSYQRTFTEVFRPAAGWQAWRTDANYWFPTVLELCGIKQQADAPKLDGHSMTGVIAEPKAASAYQVLNFAWANNWAVRKGDWKLINQLNKKTKTMELSLHHLAEPRPEVKDHAKEQPAISEHGSASRRPCYPPRRLTRFLPSPMQG